MTGAQVANAYDVVVVGAGPAGLAAAADTANAGLSTLLVDENPGPGGQIYRAITTTPLDDRNILGADYWAGASLVDEARRSGATIIQGATVWSLDDTLSLAVSRDGRSQRVSARRVIVATGAIERPFPIPGWTLPGVMTAGAAQTMLKGSGLVPAGRTILAGTGPLLWLLAAQLLRAGAEISAVLDTTPLGNWLSAARYAPSFALSPLFGKGLALRREVYRQVKVVRRITSLAAHGTTQLRSVQYRIGDGPDILLGADTLLLHQGVVPNINLTVAAGVRHHWNDRQLCWSPDVDADGHSSVPGLLIAGDGAGIAGAVAAEQRGHLSARTAIRDLAPDGKCADNQLILNRLAREDRARPFLDTLFRPADSFRKPSDATIVCRCEEVTAGEVRAATRLGCRGPNQLKAFLRAGMGPCQGRMCGLTVTELISEASGLAPEAVGHLRLRPPVKPITLAELAAMPADEPAVKAVVRG